MGFSSITCHLRRCTLVLALAWLPGAAAHAQQVDGASNFATEHEAMLEAPAPHPAPVWALTAQPRKPLSKQHDFWDRTNRLLFAGIGATRGLDYSSTRNFQARGRQEILLPDAVVNNSAGFASLEMAATMSSVGVSYLLHRTGHHKLERWMSISHISVTGFGVVRNYCLVSKHPH